LQEIPEDVTVGPKHYGVRKNYTFSIPCTTIQLLQLKPTNAPSCVSVTIPLHWPPTPTFMFFVPHKPIVR